MRKLGLLATLTLVGMMSFAAVAMAATSDPTSTSPDAQTYTTNGTGVGSGSILSTDPAAYGVQFTGQAYRMTSEGPAGVDGTPDKSGNNGTSWNSTVATSSAIKYDSTNNKVIHSSYSKTSDACASCHAVHTAVGAGNLLQWEDPQTACWACHDGTVTTTYNVINGTHTAGGATQVNSAGLFGLGTGNEAGLSNHGMSPKETAFVTTAAAPGGAENAATKDINGDWSTEFTCVACHDPHGTLGNARILNPNVNNIALQYTANITPTLVPQAPLTEVNAGTKYQGPVGQNLANVKVAGSTTYPSGAKATIVDNVVTFDKTITGAVTADLVQQGESLTPAVGDNTTVKFSAKKGNWMAGHGFDPVVYVSGVKQLSGYTVDPLKGVIKFDTAPASGATVTASYAPGMVVQMKVDGKLTTKETVKYQNGINEFCGACHTDYNNVNKAPQFNSDGTPKMSGGNQVLGTGSAYKSAIGEYRAAYRHSVGFTRTAATGDTNFTDPKSLDALYPGLKFDTSNPKKPGTVAVTVDCLTCHFAHGTSDQFIKDTLVDMGQDTAFGGVNATNSVGDPIFKTYDTTRTTALKRLPNMGVCQGCHNKTGVANVTPTGF